MRKPDFEWKWHTGQEILVLSDFTRYLVHLKYKLKEGDEGFKDAYDKVFKTILADYKNGKLTQLKHGNNLATYVNELEQYLPKITEIISQEEIDHALKFIQKFKSYLVAYEDDLISEKDMIEGLRKFLTKF